MVYNPFSQQDDPDWLYPHMADFDQQRGAIIHMWAGVESSMDQANHYAWKYSDETISNAVPQGLGWKIRLFEQIHAKLLPFHALRDSAIELLPQINALYEDRHWMAHGVMLPKKCDRESWLLMKHNFVRATGGMIVEERRFTQDELSEIRLRLIRLGTSVADYMNALVFQVHEHGIGDHHR